MRAPAGAGSATELVRGLVEAALLGRLGLGGGLLGGWAVLFPVVAIASLVIGISLIVDGVTEVIDRSP